MAIGTLAAIGLGAAGIGSFLGGKSANKAATKAANTSMQVAQQNNALAANIYGQNKDILNPYVLRGNAAGDQINALLGLGGPAQVSTATLGSQGLPTQQPYQNALLDAKPWLTSPNGGPAYLQFQDAMQAGQPAAVAAPAGQPSAQQAANNAFDIFRNSTGYQFRLGQGLDAINGGYAGAGTLQSGAALKAINEYGQNFASNEFGNYLGYLGNQQGVGLGAGSALAGVGQNYVNTISANNNSAGTAAANAALAKGANNPFANALSMLGGGILGYA